MKFRASRAVIGVCLLAWVATAKAQPVLESSPSAPLVPPSLRDAAASSPFTLPGAAVASGSLLRWGPLDLNPPGLSDSFIYSDGLQASPGHLTNTYVNSLSATLLLDIGTHWALNYTPTWKIYTNRAFQNSVDHALDLAGGAQFGDWLTQFTEAYSSTNTPLIETGRQTKQQTSTTTFGVSHRFNDRWSLELEGAQNLQFIDASPDNYDWSTQGQLTFRPGAKLELSLGYRLGLTDFDPGAYMTYSQPQAEVRWRVADKLTLSVQGGREQSQVHKTGLTRQNTPTWNVSAQYQPFDHTKLTLRATRSVTPSTLGTGATNNVTNNQGWTAEIEQRLLGHFNLDAGLSQQKTHFSGTHVEFIPNVSQDDVLDGDGNVIGTITTTSFTPETVIDLRNDSTRTFHLRLATSVMKHGTIALSYARTRNISDAAGFSFTSHQIGCEVGYHW